MKLFGRADEERRYTGEAAEVRDLGVRRALIGRWFFMALGVVSALGTAACSGWGRVGHQGTLTIGTVVALFRLPGQLYGPLTALSNARVELATSLVSFERVFEVLDLPRDIDEQAEPFTWRANRGRGDLRRVSFKYGAASPAGDSTR